MSGGNSVDLAKIFVGGLSWQTNEDSLRYHFEQYGEVASVEVMRDRNTNQPRGFAFVVFKSDETVDLVMSSGPHEINHKIVDVKRAQARGQAPPSIHNVVAASGGAAADGAGGGEAAFNAAMGGGGGSGGGGGGGHSSAEQLKCKVSSSWTAKTRIPAYTSCSEQRHIYFLLPNHLFIYICIL